MNTQILLYKVIKILPITRIISHNSIIKDHFKHINLSLNFQPLVDIIKSFNHCKTSNLANINQLANS